MNGTHMTSPSEQGSSSRYHRDLPALPHSPPNHTSYFKGAGSVEINDSHLIEVHGDQIINEGSSGLKLLYNSISRGATYDSAERSPAPRCHKKTRLSVIADIMAWIGDPDRTTQLLWLNGAPGVGKSAIVQTIAERCAEGEQLAGSFFFSGESEDRKTAERFLFTLAYQLSIAISAVRVGIEREIKADPHILFKSMGHQLERLIIRPLSQLPDLPPMVIVVDGLDECDVAGQASILELIPRLLSGLPHSFCLLISSRPEASISEAFNGSLQDLSRRVTLDGRYAPEKDIEVFLRSRLAQLSKRRVAQPWPLDSDIMLLVNACSGQFLCAVTITRYIGDGSHRPATMLKNLLNTTGSKHAALTPLDSLYSRIMSTCSDSTRLLSILGVILVSSCQVTFIEGLLGLDPGDVAQQLRGFNSVLHIPQEGDKIQSIRIRQPSFREFLLDASRSGPYFIDPEKEHARVATCMLSMHTRSNVNKSLLETSLEYWGLHCSQAAPTDDLLKVLQDFDLQLWLKTSSEGSYNTSDLADVMAWMSKTNHPSLTTVHVRWMKICYDVFYADVDTFDLRPTDLSVDKFLALTVIATIAKYLKLNTSVVCDVLEPFVTEPETLWLTLDARIGIKSPFEPSSENFCRVAEHLYHDTLTPRSDGQSVTHLDAQRLKASDGTVLPRFNLDNFNTFGRVKLDSAKCHTHFALACLAYLSSAASRSSRNRTTQPHTCETRADSYSRKNWAYHVTKSLPTQAVMINLRDFIHEEHSQTHGSEKLMLVIRWLKSLPDPPLKLISCWESASRKMDCGEISHSRTTSTGGVLTSRHRPTPPPSPAPPLSISTSEKHKARNWFGLKSSRK